MRWHGTRPRRLALRALHAPRRAGQRGGRAWRSKAQNTFVTKAGMLDRVKAFSGCSHPPPSA